MKVAFINSDFGSLCPVEQEQTDRWQTRHRVSVPPACQVISVCQEVMLLTHPESPESRNMKHSSLVSHQSHSVTAVSAGVLIQFSLSLSLPWPHGVELPTGPLVLILVKIRGIKGRLVKLPNN